MRLKAFSWRMERSEPFFVKRARRMSGRVRAGLKNVFLMSGPRTSEVKPVGHVSYWSRIR